MKDNAEGQLRMRKRECERAETETKKSECRIVECREISWGDKSARLAREVARKELLEVRCARDGRASRGETKRRRENRVVSGLKTEWPRALRLLKHANENNLFRKSAAREAIYLIRTFRIVDLACGYYLSGKWWSWHDGVISRRYNKSYYYNYNNADMFLRVFWYD